MNSMNKKIVVPIFALLAVSLTEMLFAQSELNLGEALNNPAQTEAGKSRDDRCRLE